MKQFKGFVIKEFYHIFRDYRSLIIMFGIPIAQTLIFGFALNLDIRNADIAIIDFAKDEASRQITNKILSSGYFRLSEVTEDVNDIETIFRKGKVKQVIIFESDFGKRLENEKNAHIQIIGDASDPNVANILKNYTVGIINNYQYDMMKNKKLPLEITTEIKMMYNSELKSVFMFIPGIITVLMLLISAMMTSISIAREKELGTMEVLLVSPLKPIQIVIGKVIPYVLLAFLMAAAIVILGIFVFGVPIRGNMILLLFEGLLYITLALSLGILISTVANNQQTAMLMSMFALMLPTILLSGFVFPVENMPGWLQTFSVIIPARWFIIILKGIMLKDTSLIYIWKETLIIVGMTILFIALSVKKFKIRLE